MPYLFPSDEWIKELSHQLNTSPDYEKAGQAWEGDIIFIVEPEGTFKKTAYLYLDLYHGKCREAAKLASLDERKAKYLLSASYSNWRKVVEGSLDPIQGLLTRKLKIQGDMMQIMRYPRAAKEMVSCCSRVETEFLA